MTDHVKNLADMMVAEAETDRGRRFPKALARAVLLHLRDAPTEEDFAATVGPEGVSHGADRLALDLWQTMFDRMLGK